MLSTVVGDRAVLKGCGKCVARDGGHHFLPMIWCFITTVPLLHPWLVQTYLLMPFACGYLLCSLARHPELSNHMNGLWGVASSL